MLSFTIYSCATPTGIITPLKSGKFESYIEHDSKVKGKSIANKDAKIVCDRQGGKFYVESQDIESSDDTTFDGVLKTVLSGAKKVGEVVSGEAADNEDNEVKNFKITTIFKCR